MIARIIKTPSGSYAIIEDHSDVKVEVLGATAIVDVQKTEDLARLKKAKSHDKVKEITGEILDGDTRISRR